VCGAEITPPLAKEDFLAERLHHSSTAERQALAPKKTLQPEGQRVFV
jgi:hypothetical protein